MASRFVHECGCAECGDISYPCEAHKPKMGAEGGAMLTRYDVDSSGRCFHCDKCGFVECEEEGAAYVALQAELAQKDEEIAGLKSALDTAWADKGAWEDTAEGYRKEVSRLAAQLDAISEEGTKELNAAVELRQALAKERLKVERLKGELARAKVVATLNANAQERIKELEAAFSDAVVEKQRLTGELETAQKANDSLRQLLREKGMSDEGINSCLRLDRAKERFQ